MPGGKLPVDQTVEGGAQIRVTQQGLNKLTSVVPGLLNQQVANGFCIPRGNELATDYCHRTQGQCAPGCKVNVALNQTTFSVTNPQTLTVRIDVNVDANVPADNVFFSECSIIVDGNNIRGDADIELGTDAVSGKLTVRLARIRNVDLSGLNFSGDGRSSFCDGASAFADFLKDIFEQELVDLLTPTLNDIIQDQLPNPLGIEGLVDITPLLAGISPGTKGTMEARIIPGGFVTLDPNLQGLSLGVITGANADEDITTRDVDHDSEPALCVPPIPAPNFGAPPASLPITSRSTYLLNPGGLFAGMPDPAGKDLAIGISETTLDLLGHHAVSSGAMCLGIGTRVVSQLNVGTFGILVPSVAELASDDGKDPVLLVTRPQKAIDFSIGDNTPQSPAITIHLREFELDVYPFLYERYTRAFTMSANIAVGVNLEFEQVTPGNWQVKPQLVGLSSDTVTISVLNGEFLREDKAMLEATLPTVFDLLASQLSIPPVDLPTFAGFSIDNPSVSHVVTPQDDFLALGATLNVSTLVAQLAKHDRFMADAASVIALGNGPVVPKTAAKATLRSVKTPAPELVRAALAKTGGALPEVTIDVDRHDARGRELEWSWRIDGGFWRPYTSASPLVIADRAFAWQGKYTIGLMARAKGEPASAIVANEIAVVIDSVAPHVVTKRVEWDGDDYIVPAYDIVSEDAVKIAFARPGEDTPRTEWFVGTAKLDRDTVTSLENGGELVAILEDEAGNRAVVLVAPFHGQPGEGGCDCDSSGLGGGTIVLAMLLLLGFVGPRRIMRFTVRHGRGIAIFTGVVAASSLVPACSCNSGPACELVDDCAGACEDGELPFCIDGTCQCSPDILPGRIGPYSDVAVGPAGEIWVSAYAELYGDLVAVQTGPGKVAPEAWEFIDGVPDGPVEAEGSKIRGGIAAKGPDVGMYTSIGVAPDGTPQVSYFDIDTGSLKYAAKVGGVWQTHVVDQGEGTLETDGVRAGMYSAITVRSDDGRAGIAYLAHVVEAGVLRAEVRFVAAQVAVPASAADWMSWVVDSAPVPPADPDNPEIYPLPGGLGLFVDAARQPDQAPAVVYYDRAAGDLKLALFSPQSGQFQAPITLDGSAADAGWRPALAIDTAGVAHVSYGGLDEDNLQYVSTATPPEVVDDGYRIVGTTSSGEPKPEHHFVGDDSAVVLTINGPAIAYQDATTHELLFAAKDPQGVWQRSTVAGAEIPFAGAYGFFNAAAISATNIIVSTWVIDQPNDDNWVEVFALPLGTQ